MTKSLRPGAFTFIGLALGAGLLLSQPAFAFGSLAVQSRQSGNVGYSHDYSTKDGADEEALQECGPGCDVVVQFWNGCGAYAADMDKGSTVYGWGTGSSRSVAQDSAIEHCEDEGGNACKIRVWACE